MIQDLKQSDAELKWELEQLRAQVESLQEAQPPAPEGTTPPIAGDPSTNKELLARIEELEQQQREVHTPKVTNTEALTLFTDAPVCRRSVEIQEALLSQTNRRFCHYINDEDLANVTSIDQSIKKMNEGDLQGLTGLESLRLNLETVPPADILQNKPKLENISITVKDREHPFYVQTIFNQDLPALLTGQDRRRKQGRHTRSGTDPGRP